VHPIAAVQTEYSLATRNAEIAVLQACRELGAALVAFSPVARGFLTGALRDVTTLEAKDIRRSMPRFTPELHAANLRLIDNGFAGLAREAGCTMAQLALAWLLAQGSHVIPIPGTTRIDHLEDNLRAADLKIDPGMLARAGQLINQNSITGPRYSAASQAEIDTEEF
jgi:aryl-alcohol dehydrogenase-like predicted oxidoreductase